MVDAYVAEASQNQRSFSRFVRNHHVINSPLAEFQGR